MATITICDVCEKDLYAENQHAEFKFPKATWHSWGYDGITHFPNRKKLEICFNCWHEFKKFVDKKKK